MALPVSPPPKSDDVAVHGWAGITVRVAWTLLSCGIRLRPEVLDAARRHALYHVPPSLELPKAEDRAAHLVRRFVAQARGRPWSDPWPADAEMVLTDRWARSFEALRDRASQTVLRMHYGDQRSLEYVERKLGSDRVGVEAARGGLREVLRGVARADGVPLDTWPVERLDRVLARLASWAPDACPPTWDVINGAHKPHVRVCVRCSRMVRLIETGQIEASDLQPPTLKARPRETTVVLALQVHPDSRRHRDRLKDALPAGTHALGEDLLLVPGGDPEAVRATLQLAAEVGSPPRAHLRGARVEGAGEWSTFGPLGPLAAAAQAEVRTRGWGLVDGAGPLPEPLPEPPDAWNAWGAVAGLAATVVMAAWLAHLGAPGRATPVRVDFAAGAQGTWLAFDVPELARVYVFTARAGRIEVVLRGDSAADKAGIAVGDGTYRTRLADGEVLVVSARESLPVDALVAEASRASEAPLVALSRAILRTDPAAEVFHHGRPGGDR